MLLYNATPRQNPQISGTAYGSGSATIQGNEQLINFDINMRSNPGTSIALNFMEGSKAMEYDFINFVEKDTITTDSKGSSLSSEKKQKFIWRCRIPNELFTGSNTRCTKLNL
jgi:hypothetical protein